MYIELVLGRNGEKRKEFSEQIESYEPANLNKLL